MKKDPLQAAQSYAYRLLSVKERSLREMEERLKAKGFADDCILKVIEHLKRNNFINDGKYAQEWVKASSTYRPKGVFAIKKELARKGLDASLVEEALKDPEAGYDEYEVARSLAAKKMKSMGETGKMKIKKNVYGLLARRGFSFEVINDIVDKI